MSTVSLYIEQPSYNKTLNNVRVFIIFNENTKTIW